ncbi:MAG: hypothetical protein KBS59_02320, partial [Clostridiales bacterium]|nr:hypothetical protein [Clostridiales bacterium]
MKTFLVSKIFPDSLSGVLAPHGNVIKLDDSVCFGAPLSHHPDALVGRIGNTLFVSEAETKIVNTLKKHGINFKTSACVPENEYPRDCPMNFFSVGEFFVA